MNRRGVDAILDDDGFLLVSLIFLLVIIVNKNKKPQWNGEQYNYHYWTRHNTHEISIQVSSFYKNSLEAPKAYNFIFFYFGKGLF